MLPTKRTLGQGMTEYLIIVALIAISAIAVTRGTAQNLKIGFGKISNALRGVEAQQGDYHDVSDNEVKGRDMNDFNDGVKR
jgi:Flp pilus assembly pilin Flp